MSKKKNYWNYLPKSSGLGKLSEKHKKVTYKLAARDKKIVKSRVVRTKAIASKTKAKIKAAKPRRIQPVAQSSKWHFWGSRQTLEGKDNVVASLKRQGYKVRVDGEGDYYKIYTMGKASKYS